MLAALCFFLLQADEPGAVQEIPFSLRVNQAIALGVDYLKKEQGADGEYRRHHGAHPGGTTALVAYTLARSGVRKNDESLQRALRALAGNRYTSTYAASVHLLLCEALRDPGRAHEAEESLEFLLQHQEQGVWGYPGEHLCNSNTQFALLGLRAARRMGLEVPDEAFVEAVEGLKVFQSRDGGFRYEPEKGPSYSGMTAAALASFGVLQEVARDSAAVRLALGRRADVLEQAEKWLERHFDVARNAYPDGSWTPYWHYCYLWAIERWCGLTERTQVAGRDWYDEGARWLLDTQARDGSWTGDDKPLENTCFALLFLRRATVSAGEELEEIYAEIGRLRRAGLDRPVRPGREAQRLTDWLLAGPWAESGTEKLLVTPPFEPDGLKPKVGAKLARREWEEVTLNAERWTDLDVLTGREGNRQLWVLACELVAAPPPDRKLVEAYLWLDLEDGWDVYLDGERVSHERRRSAAINGDVRIELALAAGTHRLVVLVEDFFGAAAFGARLSDRANGPPPPGLSARAVAKKGR